MGCFVIDLKEARRLVYEFFRTLTSSNEDPSDLASREDMTRDESFGWVFFWDDRRYIETGDDLYSIEGNLPLVVLRKTGQVMYLPGNWWEQDLDSRIKAFAASLAKT